MAIIWLIKMPRSGVCSQTLQGGVTTICGRPHQPGPDGQKILNLLRRYMFVAGLLFVGGYSFAETSARNLMVEFRQAPAGNTTRGTYSAGSETPLQEWTAQMVQVRNGEKAELRLNDAIPMQWLQSASTQSSSLTLGANVPSTSVSSVASAPANSSAPAASASARSNGASVTQGLAWFDAGQRLAVQVHWTPGKAFAVVKLEVQRAGVDERVGSELPRQSNASLTTTITAPLAEWISVASSGSPSNGESYRSDAGQQRQRVLQMRVTVP